MLNLFENKIKKNILNFIKNIKMQRIFKNIFIMNFILSFKNLKKKNTNYFLYKLLISTNYF